MSTMDARVVVMLGCLAAVGCDDHLAADQEAKLDATAKIYFSKGNGKYVPMEGPLGQDVAVALAHDATVLASPDISVSQSKVAVVQSDISWTESNEHYTLSGLVVTASATLRVVPLPTADKKAHVVIRFPHLAQLEQAMQASAITLVRDTPQSIERAFDGGPALRVQSYDIYKSTATQRVASLVPWAIGAIVLLSALIGAIRE